MSGIQQILMSSYSYDIDRTGILLELLMLGNSNDTGGRSLTCPSTNVTWSSRYGTFNNNSTIGIPLTLIGNSSAFTYEVGLKYTGTSGSISGYGGFLTSMRDGNKFDGIGVAPGNNVRMSIAYPGLGYEWNGTYSMTVGSKYLLTLKYDGGTKATGYVNGTAVGTITLPGPTRNAITSNYLGTLENGLYDGLGDYYICRVFGRATSDAEIAKRYLEFLKLSA